MTCPWYLLLFDHQTRNHKELPIRYSAFGVLRGNETNEAYSGLIRVGRFQREGFAENGLGRRLPFIELLRPRMRIR